MHPDQLQQQIRFQISQLSASNGASDFEKICLFFSRNRIHKNILPATGPVQAGGDQGRDFETFHSYLASAPIGEHSFIGVFSSKPVVFACSLEKDPGKKNGKIYSDVKTIMAGGTAVERIYFFSGEDIAVGVRHKCRDKIKEIYNVELEIIDAQAISQHLTDSDIFWIAIQYLKIPSDFYPTDNREDWYSRLKAEYQNRESIPNTFQEFSEIKSALRHIYKDEKLKSDLLFWLPKTDQIICESVLPEFLKRKAIYEKFVASLMGLDNVEGQEDNIKRYYLDMESHPSIGDLVDAQLLLSFCRGSAGLSRHSLSEEFLDDVANRLEKILVGRETGAFTVDTRCSIIEIYSNFLFQDFRNGRGFEDNISASIAKLNELIPLLDDTYFYPIEHLADRLNETIRLLGKVKVSTEVFEEIADRVNAALYSKAGSSVVAEKLIARAKTHLRNDEYFKAIKTLHEAKLKYFNKETLKETILSCLLLADCYNRLKLYFASKYYAMIAAYLSANEEDMRLFRYFTDGVSLVCKADYATGSWLSFLVMMDLLYSSSIKIHKDFEVEDDDDTHLYIIYPAIIHLYARRYRPEASILVSSYLQKWKYDGQDLIELSQEAGKTMESEPEQIWQQTVKRQIQGIPFNDMGPTRKISFKALGCEWRFTFQNGYELNAVAEEFISMIQILLADLHTEDLYIIGTLVSVNIVLTNKSKPEFKRIPSNTESEWAVELPTYDGSTVDDLHRHEFELFTITQAFIYEISLLPYREYMDVFDRKLKVEHLVSKVTFGRPYEDLYCNLVDKKGFLNSMRWLFTTDTEIGNVPQNPKMAWNDTLAAKYNHERSMEAIQRRIHQLTLSLSITLPALKTSGKFQNKLKEIKKHGWLDWQILFAVGTIIINHKAQFRTQPKTDEEVMKIFNDYFKKDEKDWFIPIDENILTVERIIRELEFMMISTLLRSFELEFHAETPNGKATVELLRHRFKFFEDGKEIKIF
jgi:hypothetical protein